MIKSSAVLHTSPFGSLYTATHQRLLHTTALVHQWGHAHFKLRRSKLKRKLYHEHSNVGSTRSTDSSVDKGINNEIKSTELSLDWKHTGPRVRYDQRISNHEQQSTEIEHLFGIHPVYSALDAKRRTFETLYLRLSNYRQLMDASISYSQHADTLNSIWLKAQQLNIPIIPVNKNKLDKLANYGVHQGLVLTASPLDMQQITNHSIYNNTETSSVWILINKVFDPMNLGALIRTSLYFGVEKILISTNCSKLSPVVSKASSGAMEFAAMQQVYDIEKLVSALVALDWDIIGTTCSAEDAIPLSKFVRKKNTLVIIGNEGYGIAEEVLKLCTTLITIPSSEHCPPFIDSLNVSVAAGIVLTHLSTTLS